MSLQPARGTQDLLPDLQAKHNLITQTARLWAERFGFREISTPIFEFSDVFKRTLGEASDIVNKEMYTFTDRNGEELTLRPEGTAGVARAFISEGLSQLAPLKLFYQGPMFRYERPQKGRYRQFHQFGVELLGAASPYADLDVLCLAYETLKALGCHSLSKLEINSLGDQASREAYVRALVDFLGARQSQLSTDSQRRLAQNPLRVLDSKDEGDRRLLSEAPVISNYLNEPSRDHLNVVTQALKELGIPFELNPRLVRGLDYYTHLVFEFKTDHLGAQDAILSGGRYDRLIKQMGGPDTPGVGWAAGVERLALLCPAEAPKARPVAVVPVHASVEPQCFQLAYRLRQNGIACELGYSGNVSKRMKRAAAQNCWAAILVGPDEIAKGEVALKDLDSGHQMMVKMSAIEEHLKRD